MLDWESEKNFNEFLYEKIDFMKFKEIFKLEYDLVKIDKIKNVMSDDFDWKTMRSENEVKIAK